MSCIEARASHDATTSPRPENGWKRHDSKIRQGGGGTCAARLSTLEHAVFGLDIVTTAMLPWHAMAFPLVSRQALVLDCAWRGSVRAEKRFRAWTGPELEAYRPALSEAVLDRDSVWDTCKTCSRTDQDATTQSHALLAALPFSCRSFRPLLHQTTAGAPRGRTHRILIALPDARSCLGIADADPEIIGNTARRLGETDI